RLVRPARFGRMLEMNIPQCRRLAERLILEYRKKSGLKDASVVLLSFIFFTLVSTVSVGAPANPGSSFTPDLSGPQFQPRADEAGEFSVSEQTGSPSYRYTFAVPPGRLGVDPKVSLVYSTGAREVAEGWAVDIPRIDRITGEGKFNIQDTG